MKNTNSDGHPLIMDGVAIMGGTVKQGLKKKTTWCCNPKLKSLQLLICIYILSRRGFIPTFIHPII
jgi:hypothetical protein